MSDENNPPTAVVGEEDEVQVRPVHLHTRTGNILTRKRKCNPSNWKRNVRKKSRQSGEEYVDSRGKKQDARSVKTKKDCSKCKFRCSANISEEDRAAIFKEFWGMVDNDKLHFYGKTTSQESTSRPTAAGTASRRNRSIRYSLPLDSQNVRVCKVFYLSTLDINHKRVQLYHTNKQNMCGTPVNLKWGMSKNNVVPQEVKDGISAHINSLPRVESHYNRANTKKEYLADGLNIPILYEEYVEKCNEAGTTPGKVHLYREIFNANFNIAFHVPKKDRCDTCEEMGKNENPTEEDKRKHEKHLAGKLETKTERDKDRNENNKFTICFDLQNVFALPTAEVSNFFYKRKLNVYFMTAHCSADKRGYGAMWNEGQNGRAGNDIASSVMKLLESIVDENSEDPRIKHITLWSDSCVPQNRNSHFSTAIKVFLKHHPEILSIEHKFCEPGHSSIQEVDNLHSQIESVCRHSEIYSPVGLLRVLKKVHRSKPLKIIQMKPEHFKDFSSVAKQGKYDRVPFTKAKSLLFKQDEPKILSYKTAFSQDWIAKNVLERKTTRHLVQNNLHFEVADPAIAKPTEGLSQAKKADISSMLKFMPPQDKAFMTNLVNH